MSTAATNVGTLIVRKHAYFVGFVLITSLAFFKPLSALVSYSLNDASSSHIVLIPFVSFSCFISKGNRYLRMRPQAPAWGSAWRPRD